PSDPLPARTVRAALLARDALKQLAAAACAHELYLRLGRDSNASTPRLGGLLVEQRRVANHARYERVGLQGDALGHLVLLIFEFEGRELNFDEFLALKGSMDFAHHLRR